MRFLLYCVIFVLEVLPFGNAQRDCVDTGSSCREQCLPGSNGEFQWCGSCDYYIICTNGAVSIQQCPEGLVWGDDAKRCVAESLTCEQCVVPFAKCTTTGSSCIVDCLTYPDGTYQWCGRCDYFLICSIGTTSYFKCQQDTLENDDRFKACISTSTTCFDDPCYSGRPPAFNPCDSDPCLNGGKCIDNGDGTKTCVCPDDWTGALCESPNYIISCGDLTWAEYPAKNGFTVFCYYWVPLSDTVGRNTECANVFHELPIWGNSSTLIREGGAFGCINSQNYPHDNDATSQIACQDNYQQSVILGEYMEDVKMMICIRYPYLGMMPEI